MFDDEIPDEKWNELAEYLNMSSPKFVFVLGAYYGMALRHKSVPTAQDLLAPFVRVVELLRKFHPEVRSAQQWLSTPHPQLAGYAPLTIIVGGRVDVVRDMLEAAYLGLPT